MGVKPLSRQRTETLERDLPRPPPSSGTSHPGTQHILGNSLFMPQCPSLICKQRKERDPFCSSLHPVCMAYAGAQCQNKGPHPKWSLVTSKSCSLPSSSAERGLCKTQRQGLQAAGPGTPGLSGKLGAKSLAGHQSCSYFIRML